jgi:hypothetical protein
MKLVAQTCLFVSKDGRLAIHLMEPPLPATFKTPTIPPGMVHAARVLGLQVAERAFTRTAEGGLPVYEET